MSMSDRIAQQNTAATIQHKTRLPRIMMCLSVPLIPLLLPTTIPQLKLTKTKLTDDDGFC